MIWRYYLNLVYLVLNKPLKVLPHSFPFHICTQPKPMTFWMKTIEAFKNKLEIFIEKSLDVWSNYLWVISQYEKPLEHYQNCLYKNVGKFSSFDCLF